MKLTDVQNSMYNSLNETRIGALMLQFSKLLLLVYPLFLLIELIAFLDPVTEIFAYFEKIMYFCYFAGLVACFAKNEIIFGTLAFAIKTIVAFIGFIEIVSSGYSYGAYSYINYFIDIAAYGFITYITFALASKKAE